MAGLIFPKESKSSIRIIEFLFFILEFSDYIICNFRGNKNSTDSVLFTTSIFFIFLNLFFLLYICV